MSASPGHQAGAPLRRVVVGLGEVLDDLAFPRPSGRGSIAAVLASQVCSPATVSSPGHQAGAPLRPRARHLTGAGQGASPGHQAGAPLRQAGLARPAGGPRSFPRPSGRGSIAARTRPGARCRRKDDFPRPSGRGSIAAVRGSHRVRPLGGFPRPSGRGSIAAARPAGRRAAPRRFPRPSGRGSIAAKCGVGGAESHVLASPGHQAGAPLRRQGAAPRDDEAGDLPPAIRPGLHCGVTAI